MCIVTLNALSKLIANQYIEIMYYCNKIRFTFYFRAIVVPGWQAPTSETTMVVLVSKIQGEKKINKRQEAHK